MGSKLEHLTLAAEDRPCSCSGSICNSKKQPHSKATPSHMLLDLGCVDILCSSSGIIQTPLPQLLMMIDALTLFFTATAAIAASTTSSGFYENGQIFRRNAFLHRKSKTGQMHGQITTKQLICLRMLVSVRIFLV